MSYKSCRRPSAGERLLTHMYIHHLFLSHFIILYLAYHWAKKSTIHQVTIMLATSKNVLYLGHNRQY